MVSVNLLIGIAAITVSSSFYKSSKLNDLQSIGDLFTKSMQKDYSDTHDTRSANIKKLHEVFSHEYHLMIYIYDEDGNCVLSDADYNKEPKKVVKNALKISDSAPRTFSTLKRKISPPTSPICSTAPVFS